MEAFRDQQEDLIFAVYQTPKGPRIETTLEPFDALRLLLRLAENISKAVQRKFTEATTETPRVIPVSSLVVPGRHA